MEMSTFGIHITLRSVPTPNVYHTDDEIPSLYDNNFNYKNIINLMDVLQSRVKLSSGFP